MVLLGNEKGLELMREIPTQLTYTPFKIYREEFMKNVIPLQTYLISSP